MNAEHALSPAAVLARYPAHIDTLPSLFATRVASVPHAPSLRFDAREYTYAELDLASSRFAEVLRRHGTRPGQLVACIAESSDLMVVAFLACAKLGAVFVPTNPALTARELSFVLGHSKPAIVLSSARNSARLPALADALETRPAILTLETYGLLATSTQNVLTQLAAHAQDELDELPPITPNMPLVVVYTSGTTGHPKGVVHSHRNYVWAAEAFVERMHLQPTERLLTVLPFFHINALFYSLGGALAAGAMLITADGFSASRFWDFATAVGATQFNTLAAVGSILSKRPRTEFNPRHRLRKIYGGPISAEVDTVFREEFGVPALIEGYGMSEIPGACNNPFDGPHKLGSIGVPARHPRLPMPFVAMRVQDDSGRELSDGEVGELAVKTPIAFQGYLHDTAQTAAAFRDGWFLTGDLVRRDSQGYFYFIARKKDIIRVRGENVAGAELDRILGNHPGIAEAATIGVPSELGDEDILAVLVANDGALEIADLMIWCGAQLAAIKIPRYWVWVDELPHTPSHRVAKHFLKADKTLLTRAFDRNAKHGG